MAKDAKGHGSNSRGGGQPSLADMRAVDPHYGAPSLRDATRPGIRTPGNRGPSLPPDKIDTMKTIADLRSRMSGTGPGHQTALAQGVRNLGGYSFDRGRGR